MFKVLLLCIMLAMMACMAFPAIVHAGDVQAVTAQLTPSASYNVPAGKILHINNLVWYGTGDLRINGLEVINSYSGNPTLPLIAGPGDIVSTTASVGTNINGYLTDASSSPGPVFAELPTFMLSGLALAAGCLIILRGRNRFPSL